jgi:hypothetical protein
MKVLVKIPGFANNMNLNLFIGPEQMIPPVGGDKHILVPSLFWNCDFNHILM